MDASPGPARDVGAAVDGVDIRAVRVLAGVGGALAGWVLSPGCGYGDERERCRECGDESDGASGGAGMRADPRRAG